MAIWAAFEKGRLHIHLGRPSFLYLCKKQPTCDFTKPWRYTSQPSLKNHTYGCNQILPPPFPIKLLFTPSHIPLLLPTHCHQQRQQKNTGSIILQIEFNQTDVPQKSPSTTKRRAHRQPFSIARHIIERKKQLSQAGHPEGIKLKKKRERDVKEL